MQANPLILESIELTRGGVTLFSPLSLTMLPGDLWAIHGDNGSGKSTLLKALAGLHPIHAGRALYGNMPIAGHPEYPACVTFLGHKRALRLSMSVEANIAHWARLYGTPELIDAALHYFDLEPYADTPCAMLSAGWRERVALARLIINPGPLWLLDEPMAHLDAEGISLVQSIIGTRLEQGGIVCVTSHHPIEGDRIKTINLNELT